MYAASFRGCLNVIKYFFFLLLLGGFTRHLISSNSSSLSVTLHDIVHTDKSLTLVFEYLDRDLKQYMDECGAQLSMNNVKVSQCAPVA